MQIVQSNIRSLGKRFRNIDRTSEIFVYHTPEDFQLALASLGTREDVQDGGAILPAPRGSVSLFNSDGAWLVHKNRPKESRVIGQKVWRWRQFRGRYDYDDMEKIVDVVRDCYPRTFIDPPLVEMQARTVNGIRRLVSSLPANASDDALKHCVNLYLELFGRCTVTNDPEHRPIANPRRVNWRILPEGENPWGRVSYAITNRNVGSEDNQQIILDRQEFICSFGPSEVFVGEGGFNDYLAYVFNESDVVILESVRRGNAIYVFKEDWQAFSQLTKREILMDDLHEGRIIHSTGWKNRLRDLIAG